MAKNNMDQDILKVLFSEQEIHDRIQEMGDQLYDKFHDRNPLFVGVLNGCFLFMADLVRATQCKSEVEFIGLSSYQNATKSSGVVQITRDLQRDISGRDIIVVEDILDSGNTLYFLKDYMLAKGANSITIVTLLDKPSRREKPESWLHQYWRRLDKSLIFAAILCSGCSILLLFSIWQNGISDAVGASYYRTQLFSCLLGIVCVGALSLIDYHKIAKLWFIYAPIALVLTCLCFTALGQRREGADDQAWLKIGSFQFQPSEVLKLAFILTFATHLSKDEENMNKPLHMLLLIVHGMIPTGLIALQGDYGTAIVFAVIFLGMLFTARISWKYVLALLITIPAALFAAWNFILGDTHKQRILVLLHPGTDPENLEYQQDRGLEALSNGKIFGVGLFSGEDAYVSVPEIHNDFMFAQVGQALGFVGAIAVVLVLAFLCLKVLYDGYRAKDSLGLFLCAGVFAMLFIHCVMNIGMVLKVAPVIGVPLPFISAGGTATVSMYVALGLVVSIYSQSKRKNRHR